MIRTCLSASFMPMLDYIEHWHEQIKHNSGN